MKNSVYLCRGIIKRLTNEETVFMDAAGCNPKKNVLSSEAGTQIFQIAQ